MPILTRESRFVSNGDEFSVDNCIAFTIENQGTNTVRIANKGEDVGNLNIEPGEFREFANGTVENRYQGDKVIILDNPALPCNVLVIREVYQP